MSPSSPQPTLGPADIAIDPIRVEPLSTQMPVHQLAKGGQEEIRIIERKLDGGQISLYWKVEPNLNVGWPGQLAYHLDTLVIKRRLDQLGRPLPRLIRVGDLRQIARELDHGGDTSAIKRAFEQNASVFIRAKVEYRTRDGRQETIEGYFNRYNLFFRGQRLPGGHAAETVYISLNDPYYGMISNTAWRPLDYEYLRSLAPAAQRFYELVSPRLFATLKNRRPHAWVRYSTYCRYAVQKRQPTRRRMQIQMAVIHRPHLKSGYLSQVAYRPAPADDGNADWIIHYTPGPRAHAEHDAFNRGPAPRRQQGRAADGTPDALPIRDFSSVATATYPSPVSEPSPVEELARRFYRNRHGREPQIVTPSQLKRGQAILHAADGDLEIATTAIDLAAADGREDSKGFPLHVGGVLEGDYLDRARQARDAEKHSRCAQEDRAREDARRHRYDTSCGHRAEERIAALSDDERRRRIDDGLSTIMHEYRFYLTRQIWNEEQLRAWAAAKILARYGKQGEPSYLDWCASDNASETSSPATNSTLQ